MIKLLITMHPNLVKKKKLSFLISWVIFPIPDCFVLLNMVFLNALSRTKKKYYGDGNI